MIGNVLVIEDDADVVSLLRYHLEREGLSVRHARDGESGLIAACDTPASLIVLDLMLPRMDGLQVCRELRRNRKTARVPIIMLTAKAAEVDRIVGLGVGADDYVTKPFSPKEVVARVKAALRRATMTAEPGETLQYGDLFVDIAGREVKFAGATVVLTMTEFQILEHLARRPERLVSRSEIIAEAMGGADDSLSRAVDVHMASIRRKLGPGSEYIETVRNGGYRLRIPSRFSKH